MTKLKWNVTSNNVLSIDKASAKDAYNHVWETLNTGTVMTKQELLKLMTDTFYFSNEDILNDASKRINTFDVVNGMEDVLTELEKRGIVKLEESK
jgi:hypothetical protein